MVQACLLGSPAFPFAKAVKAIFQFRKFLFQLSHCISNGSNISGFPVAFLVLGGKEEDVVCNIQGQS